jgi:hypothetical protein
MPVPHVTEQGVQNPHGAQLPSTASKEKKLIAIGVVLRLFLGFRISEH